jgi:signal transduction histidine kinase
MRFLLGFVSLFFTAALGFFTWTTFDDARQRMKDQLSAAASQAAIPLDILFDDLIAGLDDMVLDEWVPAIVSRGETHQVFFDRDGRPVGIDVPLGAYRGAMEDARKTGAPVLSQPFQRGGEWRAIVFEPRFGSNGIVRGFVGIEFSLQTLLDWWRSLRVPPSSFLSLYTEENQTWLRRAPQSLDIASLTDPRSEIKALEEWRKRKREESATTWPAVLAVPGEAGERERLIAWRSLAVLGLTLVVSADSRQVFAKWRRQYSVSFLVSLGVSLLAIGVVISVNGVVVRETRRREAALGELRVITNNLPVLIAYIDANQRFRFINATGARWCAQLISQIVGNTPQDVFSDATFREIEPYIERVISGQTQTFTSRIDFGDEVDRNVRVTFVPHHHQRRGIIGFFALSEDLTEQKKMQDQLQQAQKILLTVVLGNLELLIDQSEADDKPNGHASAAFQAARRGSELTQRLLAFARKQPLTPVAIDLNSLIEGMAALLERSLGDAIDVIAAKNSMLWRCAADPSQVENMLLNLAINARDAMPEGGRITIETENVTMGERQIDKTDALSPGRYVMLSVSDTGVGMSPDVLENAFDPFFTTKVFGKGSGLGLSMVYGFVRQTGGDVRIESAVGKGTTVRVFLPKASEEMQQAAPTIEPRRDGPVRGPKTILVVDDDPTVRSVVLAMVSKMGYSALEAADGHAAIAMLDDNPEIDLLLTDIFMSGGMNGFQLAEEVQKRNPDIKLLFTSGHHETHDTQINGPFQGSNVLAKPYRRRELARHLRQIFEAN